MASGQCELSSEMLGVRVEITYDTDKYLATEMEDICVMLARVLESWNRRRDLIDANPKVYGYGVH